MALQHIPPIQCLMTFEAAARLRHAGAPRGGAARAMQVDAEAGADAGLALGVQVVLAALLMPLIARWF